MALLFYPRFIMLRSSIVDFYELITKRTPIFYTKSRVRFQFWEISKLANVMFMMFFN